MMTVQPGDEVRVFDAHPERAQQPTGGWLGRVVDVDRVLACVAYDGAPADGHDLFRLLDGCVPGTHTARYFRTLDQAEA